MGSERVLVFRIGSLGDTIISLPAMWAAKDAFPAAEFTLLCDRQAGGRFVLAADLLKGSGLFSDYMTYPVYATTNRLSRALAMGRLLLRLRRHKFDALIYLVPSERTLAQVGRDKRFFELAGIKRLFGMAGEFGRPPRRLPLPMLPNEADLILSRLSATGLRPPPPGQGRMDLALSSEDRPEFDRWLAAQPDDGGRRWVGIGPGSKMPAKIWPADRYTAVLRTLIDEFDIWPVIFGGKEDIDVGRSLIQTLGRGAIAAGGLGLRAAAVGLSKCDLYLGNDTGTMHIAASVKTPCVAIFSARTFPGLWYPYGPGHQVIRKQVSCEGCELIECHEEKMRCLMAIEVDEVAQACRRVLSAAKLAC